jgi:hypothetical protein
MEAAQTAWRVTPIAVIADARRYSDQQENGGIASIHTYESGCDASLIDERSERPLHAAFIALIVVWRWRSCSRTPD